MLAHLNRLDMQESGANSVRYVVLRRSLQFILVLLVPNHTRSATLDSLRPLLFGCVANGVDQEGVHFMYQST